MPGNFTGGSGDRSAPLPGTSASSGPAEVDETNRQLLLAHNWRQGAVLPPSIVSRVHMYPFAPVIASLDGYRVIVVSQDCDVVHGNCDLEPAVEVVIGTPLPDGAERRHQHLRNPRLLHIELRRRDGSREAVAISPWARGAVPRKSLLGTSPDESVKLRETDLQDLVSFVARRYDRDAFPEEFAKRFAAGFEKLRSLYRSNANHILQIYLRVAPFEERPAYDPALDDDEGHRYSVDILVFVSDLCLENKAASAELKTSALPSTVRAIRKACKGVDIEDFRILSEDDLSLGAARRLRRIDLAAEQSIVRARDPHGAEAMRRREDAIDPDAAL